MKKFLNVMGCIFASLFSVVLILFATVFPLYRSVVSFTKPKTLTKVVQNIDYTALLPSSEELKEAADIEWLDTETVEEFIQTKPASKAIEAYAQDVMASLMQTGGDRKFTAELLKELVADDMDAVVEAVAPYTSKDADLTKEELAAEIQKVVNENAQEIVDSLPIPEPSEDPDEDPFVILRTLANPVITVVFVAVIVVLMGIIYACRCKRFAGMLWLGIDALLASLPMFVLAIAFGGSSLSRLLKRELSELSPLIDSVAGILSGKMTVFAIVYALLGIALITGYILLYRKFVKGNLQPAAPLEATPTAE